MNEKSLAVLEFPKVREQLVSRAAFAVSKELAGALRPSADHRIVAAALRETSEAGALLEAQPAFGVGGARDIRVVVDRAARGARLEPAELLDVLMTLQSAQRVQATLCQLRALAPLLAKRAAPIEPCVAVQEAIGRSIAENGEVLDAASSALGRIRATVRTAHGRLQAAGNSLIAGPLCSLLQEPLVTMRAGRYVVPVKQEYRTTFRGIIHDQSASGATVFMEPLELVDLNNQWRQAQIEEQQEIERILLYLSGLVAERQDEIVQAVMILAAIDLALAKARYAAALSATCPKLATDYRLDLAEARHPLLTGSVVPMSARLGGAAADGCWALVITGPNTGGKTVALKTMGLLSLMAQAGLHIPAEAGSVVAVWDDIFADIGDEQSIEQSLSTFSSHMTNIVQITRTATPRCLVLLDEIGVGTDPQEGSALARAVLSDLVARRICTVVTTHYSDLKAYAAAQPQVCNANVEFDADALRPTYRFHMGLPGRSYGLTIAAQLGLPDGVLDEARALLDPETMQVDDLLASIQRERAAALAARAAATAEQQAAGELRADLTERLARIEDEREQVLAAAQTEADGVLEAARRALRRAERAAPKTTPAAREQAMAVGREVAEVAARAVALPARRVAPAEPAVLTVGDRVRVRRLNTVGRILSPPTDRGEVEVQLGTLRTRLPVTDLMPTGGSDSQREAPAVPSPAAVQVRLPAAPPVTMEYDVRGRRVPAALAEIERYLDDAHRSDMSLVRIIHGRGTGALREAIRDWLGDHPLVSDFAPADPANGGDGATVVHLG